MVSCFFKVTVSELLFIILKSSSLFISLMHNVNFFRLQHTIYIQFVWCVQEALKDEKINENGKINHKANGQLVCQAQSNFILLYLHSPLHFFLSKSFAVCVLNVDCRQYSTDKRSSVHRHRL